MKLHIINKDILANILIGIATLAAILCALIPLNSKSALRLAHEHVWASNDVLNKMITLSEYEKLKSSGHVFLLDTRTRDNFAKGHLIGSNNIPIRELQMRAKHEVPSNETVVVYCGSTASCEQGATSGSKPTICLWALKILATTNPNTRVKVLVGLIPQFQQQGDFIVSTDYTLRFTELNK